MKGIGRWVVSVECQVRLLRATKHFYAFLGWMKVRRRKPDSCRGYRMFAVLKAAMIHLLQTL